MLPLPENHIVGEAILSYKRTIPRIPDTHPKNMTIYGQLPFVFKLRV
jgi:hypothetical protein